MRFVTIVRRFVFSVSVVFSSASLPIAVSCNDRDLFYRMIGALTGIGVTIMTTVEVVTSFTDMQFTPHGVSFLTDDIVPMRYVEIESQLKKIITVVKMRGGNHGKDIREYTITDNGIVVGERLREYRHLLTGTPDRTT